MRTRLTPLTPKLHLLQQCDLWRPWKSMEDVRQCALCDCTFTGREVRIAKARNGSSTIHCPTKDCPATPREWLHPGNPLTDDAAWQDWLRILEDVIEEPAADAASAPSVRRSRLSSPARSSQFSSSS